MLLYIVDLIFSTYYWMLILVMIGGFFPAIADTTAYAFLSYYTQPYLRFFQRFNPFQLPIDFVSPLLAILALHALEFLIKEAIITVSRLLGGI
jgi:uncharacterized protein YggT (Ycf19 family)